jgi:hypothetical protein
MKTNLCYRGVVYTSKSEIAETSATGTVAKYRGVPYPVRQPINLKVSPTRQSLKYRGVAYKAQPTTATTPEANLPGIAAALG